MDISFFRGKKKDANEVISEANEAITGKTENGNLAIQFFSEISATKKKTDIALGKIQSCIENTKNDSRQNKAYKQLAIELQDCSENLGHSMERIRQQKFLNEDEQ